MTIFASEKMPEGNVLKLTSRRNFP